MKSYDMRGETERERDTGREIEREPEENEREVTIRGMQSERNGEKKLESGEKRRDSGERVNEKIRLVVDKEKE